METKRQHSSTAPKFDDFVARFVVVLGLFVLFIIIHVVLSVLPHRLRLLYRAMTQGRATTQEQSEALDLEKQGKREADTLID